MDIAQAKTIAADLADLSVIYGLNFLTAIIVLAAGVMAARWIERTLRHRFSRMRRFDKTLVPVISQIAYYAVLIMTGVVVLAQFGVQTASIIAVLGATGLAIGLALQGTLQNVAAGMMLLLLRPFRVGDSIAGVGGELSGTVDEIGLFMTILHDANDVYVAVPNAKLWSDSIVNYSKRPLRRLVVPVGISFEDDVDAASRLLDELAKKEARVLAQPAPEVALTKFDENAVQLELRLWTKRENYAALDGAMRREIKNAFDRAGIRVPNPGRTAQWEELSGNIEKMKQAFVEDGAKARETQSPPTPRSIGGAGR